MKSNSTRKVTTHSLKGEVNPHIYGMKGRYCLNFYPVRTGAEAAPINKGLKMKYASFRTKEMKTINL